ncbi:MAG: ribbon-helix-helix domain-containing protein [Candidatus Altiarchaeota archaeon]|nr:ribbon-helix-helix domain-containing protein [Candidatus Altiarchaeota archaeon]
MEKLVTFKMEEKFIAEIDRHYKRFGFSTRAEFMRTAIRNELEKRIEQDRSPQRNIKEIEIRKKAKAIKDDRSDMGLLKREIWR